MLNTRLSYTSFDYKFSNTFRDVTDSYNDIKLPYVTSNKSDRKILYVLDYVPTEDLKSRKLLTGVTGDVLGALDGVAKSVFLRKLDVDHFSWLACSFNAFKTAGRSKEFQQAARVEFVNRINYIISKYKPDTVIILGDQATKYLIPEQVALSGGSCAPWHGTPVESTIEYKGVSHTFNYVPNLSLNPIVTGNSAAAAMMGYQARRLATGIYGSNPYAVDAERVAAHRSVYIDTIPKFNKLMDMLAVQPILAVDTETANLSKVTNTLLTIQFSKCVDFGYFLPVYHKDTPFTSSELVFIRNRLRAYFQGANKNKYHIYANGLFDLNVLRTALGCRFMANSLWDVFAGEYAADENNKFLDGVTGDYYYSLGNLAVQYGFTGYLTAEFGKKHRGSIATTALTQPLIRYGTLDTVVPFAIHEQQIRRAENIGHVKYKSLVMEQCSDLIHGFSKMSTTGSKLDVDYLFSLAVPNSPIEQVIQEMEQGLLNTPAAKKANEILSKKAGIPVKSLFGNALNSSILSLRKADHKKALFFDVLKLVPLDHGKTGVGKLDKSFQTHYKDVPEVAMYTALEKAKKLKNSFVKSFIKLLGTSEDLKLDHHIRPNYHYLKVITGRTSASDPNMQQIPNHSELAKHIKRLFIAPEGYMYVKVDYRVHEVRGWGLISFDIGLAAVFQKAKDLRDAYRLHPTTELKARLKAEADVHVINAAYFFSVLVDAVDKELRNAVKSVIFGLIYQMSINTLAIVLGKPLKFTQELVKNFNKRFPKGMKWIDDTKKFAQKNLYYENPLGFRRHVWGYLLPSTLAHAKKVHATMSRQIVNSPIQGMCAQFAAIGIRQIDVSVYQIWKKEKREVDIRICNSVHDSVENCVAYANILESIGIIEAALTKQVRQVVSKRHGFEFVVDLEIDFEIGASLKSTKAWDFSILELEEYFFTELTFQKEELGYKVDIRKVMEDIFIRQLKEDTAPKWLQQQAKNIKYVLDLGKYL